MSVRHLATLLVLVLALPTLAGCVAPTADPAGSSDALRSALDLDPLAFTPLALIDDTRAGGEPVITITPTGTILVATHPGWTHTRYPPSPNLVTPATGQSYLWRSTDNGATWTPIGLPMAPDGIGPRGIGQGVSDPDFAVDANGRIYLTDLEALAAASVSWSDDDGETWLMGNNVASTYGPIDRQWLATHGTDVYFTGNYFAALRVLKSTDGGLTWLEVGQSNCNGDISVRESDGAVMKGCGNGIDVSTDGGATWEVREVAGAGDASGITMTEPAIDAAGNVYTAWVEDDGVWLAGTSDLGETWTTPLRVTTTEGGTYRWPWVVAGDDGRVAVAWIESPAADAHTLPDSEWFVSMAIVVDAMGMAPQLTTERVTQEPIHVGYMCVGTVCQANTEDSGDRRLGDFFETAVDAEGYVHLAFATTTQVDDAISHPGYVRQTSGPRLRTG